MTIVTAESGRRDFRTRLPRQTSRPAPPPASAGFWDLVAVHLARYPRAYLYVLVAGFLVTLVMFIWG